MVGPEQLSCKPLFMHGRARVCHIYLGDRLIFCCTCKSRRGVMVLGFTHLMCLMLQTSFRRYPHNDSWELEYLSVVCKWFETLIGHIFLSMPPYNFWRVNSPFLWVIFHNSLLPYFFDILLLCLEKIVSIKSQKLKEDVRISWMDPIYCSIVYIFAQEGNLDGAFPDVGPSSS